MEEIQNIIELVPEYLIIAWQLELTTNVIQIKVYDHEHFYLNPNPLTNKDQIDQYSICPGCFDQTITEIRDIYQGWSKVDKSQPLKLIGIHNQDPRTLYIQFSLGERYFTYKRSLALNREVVYEELFGKKHNCRQRALTIEDEQYFISTLRFMPKTRKAISFYSYKVPSGHRYRRKRLL